MQEEGWEIDLKTRLLASSRREWRDGISAQSWHDSTKTHTYFKPVAGDLFHKDEVKMVERFDAWEQPVET